MMGLPLLSPPKSMLLGYPPFISNTRLLMPYNERNMKNHLGEKREELIWALSLQDYSFADICTIFNIKHRSTIMRIIARKPINWVPRWVKRSDLDLI